MEILRIIGTILILLLIVGLYIFTCYYIGLRGRKALYHGNKKLWNKLYWILFWFTALSYILSLICRKVFSVNSSLTSIFTAIGTIWLAAICYLFILFLTADIIRFILNKIGYKGKLRKYMSRFYASGAAVLIAVLIILIFGVYTAVHPVLTTYNLNINKKAGKLSSLNIVLISDIHMGISVKEDGLNRMVDSINKLKPDIVFMCGDMVDESTNTKLKAYSSKVFKNIKSKYGVFAVTGNHEYIEGDLPETLYYLKKGNVNVLQDKVVKIDDSFYVAGRNDISSKYTKEGVKPLGKLLYGTDRNLPVIVLNHQPQNLKEPEENKVDLQLSGHTHKGQFFPNNIITKFMYEDDYGYLKKGNFNLIVTSGYGTWGPPIRIGTKSEIVNIKVKFRS